MTSKNQVSPVIRISRGERDASARATHLKAASKKYLETTIERKQMSTTTNFKRIALVAVAALGLGVLSSVPSQAVINSDSLTLSSATATQTTAETYTATSAVATVSFFGAVADSVSVTAALVSAPAGNTALPVLRLVETSSATVDTLVATTGAGAGNLSAGGKVLGGTNEANIPTRVVALSSSVTTSAKYAVYLATTGGVITAPATAGTYVVRLTPAAIGNGPLVGATAQTLTITVTTAAILDKVASAANSKAYIWAGAGANKLSATADSVVTTVRTAAVSAGSQAATIYVTQLNAAGGAADESMTATISGSGTLGKNTTAGSVASLGRSLTVVNGEYIGVFADGTAGVGTITIVGATSGVTLSTKTVTFTSTVATSYAAATIAATDSSVILAGQTTKVSAFAKDGTNNVSGLTTASAAGGTTIWAFSDAPTVATVGDVTAFDALVGYSVTVTGVAVGTANIRFGNASTLAASTITSAPIAVRVGTDVPSNVTVTLDKSTYAPGEKMTMTVTVLNAAGLPVVGKISYANIFSATGVTSSVNLSGTSTLPTATIADYSNTSNTKTFTLYAPVTGGPVVFSWTGGTGLATANQVARSVTVNVTDSGAAALAAVTALATTVASLRTLIVTLTNLVLKIQKKVRA
jgi:trimeric autotransporter adhesin